MAVALSASGTQNATVGTEHSLNIQTVAGVYQALLDLTALAAGEVVEIRVYEKPTGAADTKVCTQLLRVRGPVGGTPGKKTLPCAQALYHEVTLKQINGTGRAFKWGVNSL